ncbi:tRNA (guanosine(46)-N7)-methyltransferase TrmB [Aeromicrobium wangtongii]|uniref:tRNA (guanosine(46)-N7)-methyltransferase TrmB n=1 Tax=Aeromicrobium wangtongii TaxID=2969247 RepID=UPI00201825C2|nr:tRNA (guanosine(46)-N7)-methyltransferase TrmB [Aeromicrobium wangtongii]MCL3817881.1 tRNA (guanosine(46)-N7)-methyltransferase TrmB [Aeromicrobium wangtongii]
MEPTQYRTEPVSFARRGGRLSERQQAAWDAVAQTYVVEVPDNGMSTSVDPDYVLDAEALFGRKAPLVVEIGSGRGDALVHAAQEHPEMDFLGLEVYVPGVAQTLVTMRHLGVHNIRLMVVNAAEALRTMIPEGSVHELRIWFPDPWHKKRHQKRRLITPEFARLAARVLEPGGIWRLATDWQDYADQMLEVLDQSPDFEFSGTWAPRFEGRPVTRFEGKGLGVDREIRDLVAVRRDPLG